MNKQEMAEFLAEKVLGRSRAKDEDTSGYMALELPPCKETFWDIGEELLTLEELITFIYSPDGFFAVWDMAEKKFKDFQHTIWLSATGDYNCLICVEVKKKYRSSGKDRYQAFYNAVYEAMKDE